MHVSQALRLSELSGFVTGMLSSATIMLAELKQGQGDSEGATRAAERAIAYAERNDPPSEVLWLKIYQARLWLTQGNTSAASAMYAAQNQALPLSMFYPTTIQKITQARLLLAQRKIDDSIAILTKLTTEPHNLFTVETLCLLALARQAQGDSVHALLTLEQALPLAEAENRVKVFFDLGIQMAKLLARFCEVHPEQRYAQKLLTSFPGSPNMAQTIEPLSDREFEILRLIVKWYVNALYSKLHVKTRSQAIARAHELKLFIE
jgi:ATP/maltotriose-dependent transcriptional regulator MalT